MIINLYNKWFVFSKIFQLYSNIFSSRNKKKKILKHSKTSILQNNIFQVRNAQWLIIHQKLHRNNDKTQKKEEIVSWVKFSIIRRHCFTAGRKTWPNIRVVRLPPTRLHLRPPPKVGRGGWLFRWAILYEWRAPAGWVSIFVSAFISSAIYTWPV